MQRISVSHYKNTVDTINTDIQMLTISNNTHVTLLITIFSRWRTEGVMELGSLDTEHVFGRLTLTVNR